MRRFTCGCFTGMVLAILAWVACAVLFGLGLMTI
jgi:hypothetical protein